MNNSDKPAYPIFDDKGIVQRDDDGLILDYRMAGLSKLEYAKIHAPTEIPDWFEPKMPVKPEPRADMDNMVGQEDYNEIHKLLRDYSHVMTWYEAAEDYFMYHKKQEVPKEIADNLQKERDLQKWYEDCYIERYFQWREYFAKKILNNE